VGDDGSTARSADILEVNETSLVCISPAWPFTQASTRIHVERRRAAWACYPTPYTLKPTPYTLHPKSYTLNLKR